MKKNKYIIITLILIISFTGQVNSMDTFTEDSWFGAYLIKGNNIDADPFTVFYDIRENNYLKRNPESDFKTILADYILMKNFSIFGKNPDLMEMEQEELEKKLNNNSFIESNNIELEFNLLYKIKEEVANRYISLSNNYPPYYYYRFFHIQVTKYEEATTEELNSDIIKENSTYDKSFPINENEFKDSKETTKKINDMLPMTANSMKQYRNSPLVSYNETSYSNNAKDKLKERIDDVVFKKYEVVFVQDRRYSLDDMKTIYDFFTQYDESLFDYIFNNTKINKLNDSISSLLRELE